MGAYLILVIILLVIISHLRKNIGFVIEILFKFGSNIEPLHPIRYQVHYFPTCTSKFGTTPILSSAALSVMIVVVGKDDLNRGRFYPRSEYNIK